MGKTIKTILAAVAVLGCISCEKENLTQETPVNEEITAQEGHLVSSKLVSTISLADAYADAIEKAGTYQLQGYYKITDKNEIPNLIYTVLDLFGKEVKIEDIPSLGLQIKIWTISYITKGGYNGQENIVLNADVAFLTDERGLLDRKLESISLYNSTYNAAEGDISYLRGLVIPMRAAHNALVVYPFYQGTFCDRGRHAVTPGEFLLKGRQSIDAVLAAIEFVDEISEQGEKVSLAKNYYTENMGVSNGGGTSLAVQYLLENDAEMKSANAKVRLAGTFIGEGCCSYSPIIPRLMEDAPCPDEFGPTLIDVEDVKPAAYITAAVGAYYTWVIDNMNPDDEKLAKMKNDYFNPEFLKVPFHNKTHARPDADNYVDASIYGSLYWGIFGDFDGLKIENVVNPKLVKDGSLDCETEEMKTLLALFAKNDAVLLSGKWTPKAPIHFKHSKVDEFIPVEYINETVSKLKKCCLDRNVTIEYMDDSGHLLGSMTCLFVDVMFKKHPCPLKSNCCWNIK